LDLDISISLGVEILQITCHPSNRPGLGPSSR